MRRVSAARAAVALTTSPEWLSQADKLAPWPLATTPRSRQQLKRKKSNFLICVQAWALWVLWLLASDLMRLQLNSTIVPHLIDRVLHDFAVSVAKPSIPYRSMQGDESLSSWRGFVTEVEDFANAVWRGAKGHLKGLFEEDVNIRLWVRIATCPSPSCGRHVPLISNAKLSSTTALKISPDLEPSGERELPRFGLQQTGLPGLGATLVRGICTCPACGCQFPLRGRDLIPLRMVPVAVRTRNSSVLSEINSPSIYVTQVDAAAYDSVAASSQRLGNRVVLANDQPLFYYARGEPISVRDALLPRQRAYFAALAESIDRESVLLASAPR